MPKTYLGQILGGSIMPLAALLMSGRWQNEGADVAQRIVGAALASGGASGVLRRLTDEIGGRVSGTARSLATSELLRDALVNAGFSNARFEEYRMASTWQRGKASGRITSPLPQQILVGSFGWSPGSSGEIEGLLVDLGTPRPDDLAGAIAQVRGAVVLASFPSTGREPSYTMRAAVARILADAGALALLIPAGKPDRLLDIGCFGNYPRAALPMLSVADEDVLLLRRMLSSGPTRVALDIENSFDGPVQERNVIADLPGRANPEEMIIVGGHLDSWDTGQGALDDGAGVAAVVDAARILHAIEPRPRRTIRFAFFSGEEQAILGSAAYVAAHRSELDRVRAVLIMDEGAELPKGFRLHGRTDLEEAVRRVLGPLAPIGATGISQEASFDMDHSFFLAAGVPVLTLWVEPGEYDIHHHAITDTYDKVDPRKLALDTAVTALSAYLIADVGEPLGARLSADETAALLRREHLESSLELLRQP